MKNQIDVLIACLDASPRLGEVMDEIVSGFGDGVPAELLMRDSQVLSEQIRSFMNDDEDFQGPVPIAEVVFLHALVLHQKEFQKSEGFFEDDRDEDEDDF